MQCPTPLYLRDKVTAKWSKVPCGKCEICLDNKRQDWFVRLLEEMKASVLSLFVTLTYDEEFVPIKNGIRVLNEDDVTSFFMKLRKRFQYDKKDIKFKYYLASEYGSLGQRPHYHTCFFFKFDFIDAENYIYTRHYIEDAIRDKWGKGFVDIGLLRPGGIAYTTKYIHKKRTPPEGAVKPFQRQSHGLGEAYVQNFNNINYHKRNVIDNNKYTYHQTTYRLPRYFREKLFNETELRTLRREYEKRAEQISDQEWQEINAHLEKWRTRKRSEQNQITAKKFKIRKSLKMSSGEIDN